MIHSIAKPEPRSRLEMLLLSWSKYFALTILFIVIFVLIGWPVSHLTPMSWLTASAFLLSGASFLALSRNRPFALPQSAAKEKPSIHWGNSNSRFVARAMAMLVLLTGLPKITEPVILSNQMTAQTAFCFFLSGLGLLFLNRETPGGRIPSQFIALPVAAVSLFSLLGYLYQVHSFPAALAYTPMAVHTATCFLFLSLSILLANPGKGFIKVITSSNSGGINSRSLLPLVILLPIALGYLPLLAYRRELISTEFGVETLVSAIILAFTAIVWYNARLLPDPIGSSTGLAFKSMTEQKRREKEITDYKYALDQASIVSITDEKGTIKHVNDNFCRVSKFTAAELIGQDHRIISSNHHPAAFISNMWGTISKGIVWNGDFCNKAKDGSHYWVNMTIVPFLNDLGVPFEYIALDSNITERKRAEASLVQSHEDIRHLAAHLQNIREEERKAIAREIHDELGQQLTGLKLDLSWIGKREMIKENTEISQKVLAVKNLLDATIKTVRKIATDLRPDILDDLGLIAAIEWQSQEFEKRSGISTTFISTVGECRYSSVISIGLFRICQETLTNVARHANASKIHISLQEQDNDNILLKIEDNGNGFEVSEIAEKKTLGLLGMKERTLMMGGRFRLESHPGKGTTLFVTIPLIAN